MKKMTEQNLINAFGGESQANMRYRIYDQNIDSTNPGSLVEGKRYAV